MHKNLILIVVFLLLTFVSILNAQISLTQRQGLIDFYNAMDGDNWINNSHKDSVLFYYEGDETPHYQCYTFGWMTNGEFSPPGTEVDWFGVYASGENPGEDVAEIIMPNSNLSGELTLNLLLPFDSYFLKLNLSGNVDVTGELPNFNYLIAGNVRGFRLMNTLILDGTSISGGF